MKNSLIYFIIMIISYSCNNSDQPKNVISKIEPHQKDSIQIEKLIDDRNSIKNKFLINGKSVYMLPKDDTISIKMDYNQEFSEIIADADFLIEPMNGLCEIRKIDNHNYKLFIDPEYNEPTITFIYLLTSNKFIFGRNIKGPDDKEHASYNDTTELILRTLEIKQ